MRLDCHNCHGVAARLCSPRAGARAVCKPRASAPRCGGAERAQQARARTRLRVRPIYPYRRYHSLYPVPYASNIPGPNAKRECVARYVEEYRPSGTVIVPRMRCWWVRG